MAAANKKTVVGVFDSHARAQQAVAELRQAGFRDDQIGVIARNVGVTGDTDGDDVTDNYAGEGAATGLAAGAGLGALWGMGIIAGVMPILGPAIAGGALAAILTSAAAGAAAAGLAGALVGMGIPKEEAEYYEKQFHAGNVLVTVTAGGRALDAESILRNNGGHDITSKGRESQQTEIGRTPDMGREHVLAGGAAMTPGGQSTDQPHRTIDVPIQREEVEVERHVAGGGPFPDTDRGETHSVPVRDEQVDIEKQPVPTRGKRKAPEHKQGGGPAAQKDVNPLRND